MYTSFSPAFPTNRFSQPTGSTGGWISDLVNAGRSVLDLYSDSRKAGLFGGNPKTTMPVPAGAAASSNTMLLVGAAVVVVALVLFLRK